MPTQTYGNSMDCKVWCTVMPMHRMRNVVITMIRSHYTSTEVIMLRPLLRDMSSIFSCDLYLLPCPCGPRKIISNSTKSSTCRVSLPWAKALGHIIADGVI